MAAGACAYGEPPPNVDTVTIIPVPPVVASPTVPDAPVGPVTPVGPVMAVGPLPVAEVVAESVETIPSTADDELLNLNLRFDGSFFAGNGGIEGFALPSYRVSLFGKVAPRIRYRMSLGQVREFSTALLPQIVPVEAFAVFAAGDPKRPTATVTAGLFSPSIVPWWTPDLSDLPLPDYASVHRAMLIGREMGAELSVAAIPGYLEAAVGFVNGTGIFGTQSGSTRAVTAMIRSAFGSPHFRVMVGAGGYHLAMGSSGSPNFRSQNVLDAFFQFRIPSAGVTLGGDAIFGWYEDAFRTLNPSGGNLFLLVDISETFEAYARYEFLDHWWGDTPSFRRLEFGPIVRVATGTKLFLLLRNVTSNGASEGGGEVRLRLQL